MLIGDTLLAVVQEIAKKAGNVSLTQDTQDLQRLRIELNRLQALSLPRTPGKKGGDIESARQILLSGEYNYFHVTGRESILSFSPRLPGSVLWLEFDDALTLIDGDYLILQDDKDFVSGAGDVLTFIAEDDGVWREAGRQLATPAPDDSLDEEDVLDLVEEFLTTGDDIEWVREENSLFGEVIPKLPNGGTSGNILRDNGTDFVSSNIGVPTFLRKSADEIVTSSTTLQNDNHLLQAIGSNETWVVEFFLALSNTGTAGFKAAITWPASPTNAMAMGDLPGGGTGSNAGTFTETSGTIVFNSSNAVRVAYLFIYIANGANAGNIQLQWAQEVSNAANTTVEAGSWLRATRVA